MEGHRGGAISSYTVHILYVRPTNETLICGGRSGNRSLFRRCAGQMIVIYCRPKVSGELGFSRTDIHISRSIPLKITMGIGVPEEILVIVDPGRGHAQGEREVVPVGHHPIHVGKLVLSHRGVHGTDKGVERCLQI